jgi:hypothetical protein
MRSYFAAGLAVILTLGISGIPLASAQQVSSFQQLQLLVKPGDKITVVSPSTLKTTVGKIKQLTPSELRLTSGGVEQQFSEQDVLEIRQRRSDSLGNGAIWGAAILGGGTALIFGIACSVDRCANEDVPLLVGGVLIYTGIGAGVGVGIDAMIKGNQTVYRNPNRTAYAPGLHVAPVLSGRRKGVAVSFTF